MGIPEFITHYSRREPFRSLTNLSWQERENAIATLNESNAWGLNRFRDPEYLNQRMAVEKILFDQFKSLGGEPEIQSPIYFFLGCSEKFESHPLNRAYKIHLSDLSERAVSFTYGDSLLAFHENLRKQVDSRYQNPLCGRLFLKAQLQELFLDSSFPKENPLHIEAQLWVLPPRSAVRAEW